MAEYYLHILNYPIEADSPDEAVREAVGAGPDGLVWCLGELFYHVTDREVDLRPRVWDTREGGFEEKGFGVCEAVDASRLGEDAEAEEDYENDDPGPGYRESDGVY